MQKKVRTMDRCPGKGFNGMEYVLKTEQLTKKFGKKAAVDHVSMSVGRSDIYGFIGKNGAGKTTLMRLVLGLAKPQSGKIELFGGESYKTARRRIGSLIEAPSFYKNCTARENLLRFGSLCDTSPAEVEQILELVGLQDAGRKTARYFSLGMKQRLGIGIALLGRPEFLVLDEPVNGLDPTGIKDVRDLILRLNREMGITFLISSHLLDELSKIVTKYGIINNGVLIEEITAQELAEKCRSRLVISTDRPEEARQYLAASAENVQAECEKGELVLYSGHEDPALINRKLVEAGFSVSRLALQSENTEDYFVERIGDMHA